MKILVTGSAGHLGEALMRSLPEQGHQPLGLDIKPSPSMHRVTNDRSAMVPIACVNGDGLISRPSG